MFISRINGIGYKSTSDLTPSFGQKPKVTVRPFDLFCSIQDRIVQDMGMQERSVVEITDEERFAFKLINSRCWDIIKKIVKSEPHENVVHDMQRSNVVMFEVLTQDGIPYVQVGTIKDGLPHSIAGYYNEKDGAMTVLRFDKKGRVIGHPASDVLLTRTLVQETRRHRRASLRERSANLVFPSRVREPNTAE